MPEGIVMRSRGFSPNLYFEVSFETRKFRIKREDNIKCTFKRTIDSGGNVIRNVDREINCEVLRRDDQFYLDSQFVQGLNLLGGKYYELILQKQIKEVEIT